MLSAIITIFGISPRGLSIVTFWWGIITIYCLKRQRLIWLLVCNGSNIHLNPAMEALRVTEDSLKAMRKGAIEKQVIAWYIHTHTTVSNDWISTALYWGHCGKFHDMKFSISRCIA